MANRISWTNKPPIGAEINFCNPISNQMVLCIPFWEGGGNPLNIINNRRSTVTNTLGWSTGFLGLTRDITPIGGSNTESFTLASTIDWQHGPFTIMCYITFRSFQTVSPNISGIFYNNGSGGNSTIMRLNDASTANNAPNWIVVNSSLVGNARLIANIPYQLAMTYDGTTLIGYVNGAVDATKAVAVTAGAGGSTGVFWRDDSTARGPDAKAHISCIWKRVLSAQELNYLYTNPFAMFLRPSRRNITQQTGIAFDAASNSTYQAAQSTYSWTHICTGTNRFLGVDISVLSVPGTQVTGITYNSVALSFIGAKSTVSGAGRVESWGLANPTSGSNTIAVTLSASVASAGTAVSYTGVHQSSPTEAYNSAQATNVGAADASVAVTSVADNCWIHAAVATDDTTITANQTSRNNVSGAGGSAADEDTGPITPAGATTMSYTNVGALATWAIGGYAIRPIGSSSPLSTYFRKSLSSIGTRTGSRQVHRWN